MKVVAKHVFGNLYECDKDILRRKNKLIKIVKEAVKISNSKLIKLLSYKFKGGGNGISVIAIVAESHISIHTYPEYRFALVDVFTCGTHTKPEKAFEYIVKELKAKFFDKKIEERSLK